ncbi:MAG: GyrI-like domain-containing protein [Steroidobacterales bacterium]
MDVQVVVFPETRVAAIEHFGSPALEHDTVRKLIAWKLEQCLLDPLKCRSYGIHYTDPRTTHPPDQHVDFCRSSEYEVEPRLQSTYTNNSSLRAANCLESSRFFSTTSMSDQMFETRR